MGLCKDCLWWEPTETLPEHVLAAGHQVCTHPKFVYEPGVPHVAPDELAYWDYEEYSVHFSTGPHFGCVHFEQKGDVHGDHNSRDDDA